MKKLTLIAGLSLAILTGCSHGDFKNGKPQHDIQVVEETAVLEITMSEAEPGLPYFERNRIQAFLSDYRARGYRHGPLVVSAPQNSPWAQKLELSVQEALALANNRGVRDVARSDYESNGAPDAPLVLAFQAYRAIPPKCKSLASINLARTGTNDPQAHFGCAQQANLAAMIVDPADLIMPRQLTPADVMRRIGALQRYRAGEITASERSADAAISTAVADN